MCRWQESTCVSFLKKNHMISVVIALCCISPQFRCTVQKRNYKNKEWSHHFATVVCLNFQVQDATDGLQMTLFGKAIELVSFKH